MVTDSHSNGSRQAGEVIVDGKRLETLWIEPDSANARMAASREPTGDRPVIVMLHEGLGSVAMWKQFPHQVAAATGCRVLAYSRYGHGSSERLAEARAINFMHHEGEVVLPGLLERLEIRKPVLLGHSDGGSIALVFAGTYPGNVRALILEAPHVFVEGLSVHSITRARPLRVPTNASADPSGDHAGADACSPAGSTAFGDPPATLATQRTAVGCRA